jgi:hypothetical protein
VCRYPFPLFSGVCISQPVDGKVGMPGKSMQAGRETWTRCMGCGEGFQRLEHLLRAARKHQESGGTGDWRLRGRQLLLCVAIFPHSRNVTHGTKPTYPTANRNSPRSPKESLHHLNTALSALRRSCSRA